MTDDTMRDAKHDGKKGDPNAGRRTPGQQERPMSAEETLDIASNDSMDASDPPSITQPGRNDPVPSSGFPEGAAATADIGGVQGNTEHESRSSATGDAAKKARAPDR